MMKEQQQLYKIRRNLPKALFELVLEYAYVDGYIIISALAQWGEIPRHIRGKWSYPRRDRKLDNCGGWIDELA